MSIELQNVTKTFGDVCALDDVTLTFEPGHIYGLLGGNGAGKSTLLSILTDRQRPDHGQVRIDGDPVENNDRAIGKVFLVGEQNFLPLETKVSRAFTLLSQFYPDFDRAYAENLARQFGLPLKKKLGTLSTGYSSIFRLILALSCNAPYVIFDEPVLGLDAQHRDLFYRLLVEKFADSESTMILSTHLISEVENLVDHTVILREGRILRDAPTEELTASAYTISGPAGMVDEYTAGRTVLTSHDLGGLKTAVLQGSDPSPLPAGLERGCVKLQDYFISLQESEGMRKDGTYEA